MILLIYQFNALRKINYDVHKISIFHKSQQLSIFSLSDLIWNAKTVCKSDGETKAPFFLFPRFMVQLQLIESPCRHEQSWGRLRRRYR